MPPIVSDVGSTDVAFWHSLPRKLLSLCIFFSTKARLAGGNSDQVKQRGRLLFGITIALVSSWLVMRNVQFEEVAHALSRANYFLLIPAIAAVIASLSRSEGLVTTTIVIVPMSGSTASDGCGIRRGTTLWTQKPCCGCHGENA